MSTPAQTLAIMTSVILAYFWLSMPSLSGFSLQAFCICILIFFLLKKANQKKLLKVLPKTQADEMSVLIFALLILVGATGQTASLFFPLIYVYVFFLSMACPSVTAITITFGLILFFYALAGQDTNNLTTSFFQHLSVAEISHLVSLPIMLIFFLFAKRQFFEAHKNKTLVEIESKKIANIEQELSDQQQTINYQTQVISTNETQNWSIKKFISQFLKPKIEQIQQIQQTNQPSDQAAQDQIKTQLTQIQIEIERILKE